MNMSDFRSLKGGSAVTWIPRLGKIRLGLLMPSRDGKREYPKEVDYFVLDSDLVYREEIVKKYGERPTKLLVMFASDDREEVFPQSLKAYSSVHGLVCRGDGEAAQRVQFEKRGDKLVPLKDDMGARITKACKCPCPWLKDDKCRAVGNLMVILPEITLTGTFGIDTGSFWSMTNVNSALEFSRMTSGRQKDLLFWLERVETTTHDGGIAAKHYPLRLRMLDVEENAKYRSEIAARYARYHAPVLGTPGVRYAEPPALPDDALDGPEAREVVAETPEPDSVPRGETGADVTPGLGNRTDPNAAVKSAVQQAVATEPAATAPQRRARKAKEGAAPAAQPSAAPQPVAQVMPPVQAVAPAAQPATSTPFDLWE